MPGNDEILQTLYVEIKSRDKEAYAGIDKLRDFVSKRAQMMEDEFKRKKINFDTTLARKSVTQLIDLRTKLQAKFQQRVRLNMDLRSINQTRNQLRSVETALQGVETAATRTGQKMQRGLFSKMTGWIGLLILLKKAFDFGKESKNLARDAEEIGSKFNTVFSSIQTDANNLADNFSRNFGIAKTTSRELLSSTGDLLVGFGFAEDEALKMSERVNTLAQDLASFTNFSGGAKGASDALTKAILGETESAKSLGIVIRQNTKQFQSEVAQLVKNKGITEQQAKAIIILDQAYAQSFKAVGDYDRTKDSLANTERRLNEELKEQKELLGIEIAKDYKVFLQLIVDLSTNVGGANKGLTAFNGIIRSVVTSAVAAAAILKILGGLLGTLGATIATFFDQAGSAIGDFFSGEFSKAFNKILTIQGQTNRVMGEGIKIIEKDWQSMTEAITNLWSDSQKSIVDNSSLVNINNQTEDINKNIDDTIKKIQDENELRYFTNELTVQILENAKATLQALIPVTSNLEDQLKLYRAIADITKKIEETKPPALDLPEGEIEDIILPDVDLKAQAEAQEKIKQLRIAAIEDEFAQREALINLEFENELANLKTLALTEQELSEATDNLRKQKEIELANLSRQKFQEGLSAAGSIVNALSKIVGSGNAFVEALNTALSIAEAISATIQAINIIGSLINPVSAVTSIAGATGKAIGGNVTKNKPYLVGELGTELFIPQTSGMIVPNSNITIPKNSQTSVNSAGNTDKLLSTIAERISALTAQVGELDLAVDIQNNAPEVETIVRKYKGVENRLSRSGIKFNEET